jgi:predicted transcriptional regulator
MKNAKQSAIERLFFLQKVESGLKDIDDGKVISHEEVKKRLGRWLK